jgi:hypothetical protein
MEGSQMDEGHVLTLLIVFAVPTIAIVTKIVCKSLVRVVCHWRDVSLKMRLVERGMDPLDIEQIVNAGRWENNSRAAKPIEDHVRTFGGFSKKPRRWFGRRRDQQTVEIHKPAATNSRA